MEMCYEGTLAMPSNYVALDSEEMTYVEGGKVWTTYRSLKEADKAFGALAAAGATGTMIEGALTTLTLGFSAVLGVYSGYITSLAASCYNKTQAWLDKGISPKRNTETKLTTYCYAITALSVKLC